MTDIKKLKEFLNEEGHCMTHIEDAVITTINVLKFFKPYPTETEKILKILEEYRIQAKAYDDGTHNR